MAALQLSVFIAAGSILLHLSGRGQNLAEALLYGYAAWFFLFELAAVPLTLLRCRLSTLSAVMTAAAVCILAGALYLVRPRPGAVMPAIKRTVKAHSWMGLFPALTAAVLCYCAAVYTDRSMDAAYYVAAASEAVYRNDLVRYNPYTGYYASAIQARYAFSAYPFHNAVMAQISGVPAIVQARLVMPVLNMLTACAVWHATARELFSGSSLAMRAAGPAKREAAALRAADAAVFLAGAANFLMSNTLYTSSAFLFTRLYEGKSILANIALPMTLLLCVRLYKDEKDRPAWLGLFLLTGASLCFSGSGITCVILAGASLLPLALLLKKPKILLYSALALSPAAVWALGQLMAKLGVIPMTLR